MPGKRVLPVVAAKVWGDYAEGLGRYLTGFLSPPGEKGSGLVQAVSLMLARRADNQTI
jgi:hypothetical protein